MLSYFNRLINIKRFVRKLKNGKKIEVKPHSRRAAMMRIKEGLKDLTKRNEYMGEGAYTFDIRTGKLSKYIEGDEDRVSPFDLMITHPSDKKYNLTGTLHNHPNNFAPLSTADVVNNHGVYEGMMDMTGNMYAWKRRVSDNPEIDDYIKRKIERVMNPDIGYEALPGKNDSAKMFRYLHFRLEYLKEKGLLRYKTKLTPRSKQIINSRKGQEFKKVLYAFLDLEYPD